MANFTGTLNPNSVYSMLFNAYRLITTIGDNLEGLDDSLAKRFKIDGGEYEDQLVWTYVDILKSYVFDPDDTNVLEPGEKVVPKQQTMKVDKVRQISLYIPTNFLTKQAFMNPSYYDTFQTVVEKQVGETRRVYDQRLVDVYVGTTETDVGLQKQTVTLAVVEGDAEATNRLQATAIAEAIANIYVDMKDSTRDYNDLAYLLSTPKERTFIVWNSLFYNKILKVDLPTIYNKEGLLSEGEVLPSRYFGKPNTAAGTVAAANKTIRSLIETDYTVSGKVTHVFPGDLLPAGATYKANETYTVDDTVICKIISNDAVKYLSAIETESEFWNPKNYSRNRYLTFMYGDPDRLAVRPFVTLRKA